MACVVAYDSRCVCICIEVKQQYSKIFIVTYALDIFCRLLNVIEYQISILDTYFIYTSNQGCTSAASH